MEKWHPDVRLKPSLYALLWGVLVSTFVLASVFWMPLAVSVRVCLLLVLCPLLARKLWQLYFLREKSSVLQLRYTEGAWLLIGRDGGDWCQAVLLPGGVVTTHGVFLRFVCHKPKLFGRHVYTALILRDSLDAISFRRLKVFLSYVV